MKLQLVFHRDPPVVDFFIREAEFCTYDRWIDIL